MTIPKKICDHCGKEMNAGKTDDHRMFAYLDMRLHSEGELKHFDFCNEMCLREFLDKRRAPILEKAIQNQIGQS